MKIGLLLSWTEGLESENPLQTACGQYRVVYSWKELPKSTNKRYSKDAFNFIKVLSNNSILKRGIEEFRREFNLPEEGLDFVKNIDIIRNKQRGAGHPIFCYENALPEEYRHQAQQRILDFIREHNIGSPLQHQIAGLFYCGIVDVRINDSWKPLAINIPTAEDIEKRAWGYRIPIRISLNSASLTKKAVKSFIDENWDKIQQYFKQFPAVMDISVSDKEAQILEEKENNLTSEQVLEKIHPISLSESAGDVGSVEQINQQVYRIRKKASQIITAKEP